MPFSPVHRQRKLSAVSGTVSAYSSNVNRPTAFLPVTTSLDTRSVSHSNPAMSEFDMRSSASRTVLDVHENNGVLGGHCSAHINEQSCEPTKDRTTDTVATQHTMTKLATTEETYW